MCKCATVKWNWLVVWLPSYEVKLYCRCTMHLFEKLQCFCVTMVNFVKKFTRVLNVQWQLENWHRQCACREMWFVDCSCTSYIAASSWGAWLTFHHAASTGDHSPDGHSSGMYLHVFRYPPPAVCADSLTTSQSRHKVVIPQFPDWEMLQSPSIQSLMHIIFLPPHTHTHNHTLVVQSSRPPPPLPSHPMPTRKSTRRSFHLQETFFFNFNTLPPCKRVAMVRVNCLDMVQFY